MISYAGVPLVAPPPASLLRIEAALDSRTLADWERTLWPGRHRAAVVHPYFAAAGERPLRVNELYWPVGASQWSIGRFLADDEMLGAIRQAVYAGASGYQSATLVLDEGPEGRVGAQISASLYLLPPRPVWQAGPPSGLWLLALVDDRWFWAERSGEIVVTEGTTTWANLYAAIAALLGITLTVEAIPAAYGMPPAALTSHYESLPTLLDTVAAAVGQRIVRRPTGQVLALSATASRTEAEINLQAASPYWAGGLFDLHL